LRLIRFHLDAGRRGRVSLICASALAFRHWTFQDCAAPNRIPGKREALSFWGCRGVERVRGRVTLSPAAGTRETSMVSRCYERLGPGAWRRRGRIHHRAYGPMVGACQTHRQRAHPHKHGGSWWPVPELCLDPSLTCGGRVRAGNSGGPRTLPADHVHRRTLSGRTSGTPRCRPRRATRVTAGACPNPCSGVRGHERALPGVHGSLRPPYGPRWC
jgi:hypothetical protein